MNDRDRSRRAVWPHGWRAGLLALASLALGCAGGLESQSRASLVEFERGAAPTPPPVDAPELDGSLSAYLAFALEHSPETRAAFHRWRASVLDISRARRVPEPTLSFGYFVRSVETRVGPQRFRIGLAQTFPWPTRLSAGADAAAERANAAQLVLSAETLRIKRDVATAYWRLWLIDEQHRIESEHDAVLEALAGAVRGRLRVGAATLADLNQIELNIARHHDHHGEHEEAARRASAMLLAAIGATAGGGRVEVTDEPIDGLPQVREAELRALARRHPRVEQHEHLAASERHRAAAERADRFPRFRVGLDWIETGDAETAGVPDSGKDAVVVSAGISIPLWPGSYSDAVGAARAASAAHEADREAAVRRAEEAFEALLADVRDAQRRIELYEKTLVPQAESTFRAVLGSYQAGEATVAAVILAQRDLLDLQLEHARARAEHARALVALEYIVGRELELAGDTP